MSELKVLVSDSFAFASDQVAIAVILQHSQEERSVLQFDQEGYTRWTPVEYATATKPTLQLQNDVARALLDALIRHYQGASDMHTVRADLLHERGRVDIMIKALIDGQERALSLALGELPVPEIFLVKTKGGPHPGTRYTDETQYPWPLPGILGDTGGSYIKITESNAAPQEPGSRLVRGALYQWFSEEQLQEASSAQAEV